MAKPTAELEISGRSFKLTALGSKKGQEVLTRLMRLVGPSVEALTGEDEAGILRAFGSLFSRITADELGYFVTAFGEVSEVEQEHGFVRLVKLSELEKDDLWAANYGAMFTWLKACVELNYASFLAGAVDIARRPSAGKTSAP